MVRVLDSGGWPQWVCWIIIAASSALVTVFLIGSSRQAWWGIVDDHEVISYLGPDGQAVMAEFPQMLKNSEIGQLGTYPRCRPAYSVLRVVEIILWDDSPALWYMARMVVFFASLVLFWRALGWWIGVPVAGSAVLYCLTYPFWGDIFCRLGPGETYCVLGTAMFVFGMVGIVRSVSRTQRQPVWSAAGNWLVLTLGALLAMGSKENFLLMLLPTWALLVWVFRKGRSATWGAVCGSLITGYGALIGFFVIKAVRRTGCDVYAGSARLTDRLALLGSLCRQVAGSVTFWELAGLLLLGGVIVYFRKRIREFARPLVRSVVILAGLSLLYASQYVFYNGDWPNESRYDFPGVLARPFVWVTLAVLARDIFRLMKVKPALLFAGHVIVLLVLACVVSKERFPIRWNCQRNVRRTRLFRECLDGIADRAKLSPVRPLLLVARRRWDYELVLSATRFFAFKGVSNPVHLQLAWEKPESEILPIERQLQAEMIEWSQGGRDGILPVSRLQKGELCFGVGLSGPPNVACESLGQLWGDTPGR